MRVLEKGEVGAGDEIERLAVGPQAMSVREVSDVLYLARAHPAAPPARPSAIPALRSTSAGQARWLASPGRHRGAAQATRGRVPPAQ